MPHQNIVFCNEDLKQVYHIMRMEMLNHNFFIYRDDETKEIAVVYKRHDGGYGLIETE